MPGGQVLLLLAGLAGAAGKGPQWDLGGGDALVITVSNGGPWGDWAWPEMCPKGFYASGVSFKVQPPRWFPQPGRRPCSQEELTPCPCSLAGRGAPGGDERRHGAQWDSAALLPRWGPQWWLHSRVTEWQVSPQRFPPQSWRAASPSFAAFSSRTPWSQHLLSSLPHLDGAGGRKPSGAPTEGAWWALRCGSSRPMKSS